MSRRWAAAVCSAWIALALPAAVPAGVASADCTGAGDFGAASGCEPPGGSSGSGDSWPPTGVDWPPNADSDRGTAASGGDSSGHQSATPAPIVLPLGQPAPPTSETPPPTPTPIVPVGAPPG